MIMGALLPVIVQVHDVPRGLVLDQFGNGVKVLSERTEARFKDRKLNRRPGF